jgi:cell division septation protein DedD
MSMIDDSNVRTTQSENLRPDSEVGEAGEGPAGDELVRVVGQDELFNSMRKGPAEAEQRATDQWPATVQLESIADWLSRTHSAKAEFRCSGASQHAKHARIYPHGDPLAEALRQPDSVDAGADDAQYASGTEGNGHGHDPRYVDPQGSHPSTDDQETGYEQSYAGRERRRGSLITVAAVLGLAIVGTAGAFGYGTFTGSGGWSQPTVIKADNTPTSIAPSPSSSDGQGSKLIHERADKLQPEPVLSQEQPIEVKDAAPKVLTAVLATGPRTTSSQEAMDYAPASTGTVAIEPQKVKTFAIRPDGASGMGSSESQASSTSVPTRLAATQSADATRAPTGASTHTPSIPTAATASAPRASGAYVVQLVSNKSEAETQSSFKVLQNKHPTVLGNRSVLIRRVELGDRGTYYRAHVGPFAKADQANVLCDRLKSAGGQCLVHKN